MNGGIHTCRVECGLGGCPGIFTGSKPNGYADHQEKVIAFHVFFSNIYTDMTQPPNFG
jgi:hypothetical protein